MSNDKTHNPQSLLISYWQRPHLGRRYLIVAWHDVPRVVHDMLPRLYRDIDRGNSRMNVIDEEGSIVFGPPIKVGGFTVGRPFPTTLYNGRLQVGLTSAKELGQKGERCRARAPRPPHPPRMAPRPLDRRWLELATTPHRAFARAANGLWRRRRSICTRCERLCDAQESTARVANASTMSPRALHAAAQRPLGAPIAACAACKRLYDAAITPCMRCKGLPCQCLPVCTRCSP